MERELLLKELTVIISESFHKDSFEKLMCTGEERVLMLIDKAGGTAYPKQLSDAMNVTMPRVTTILNGMDKKGLIVRQTSQQDRRKVEVSITKKGRSINRKRDKLIKEYAESLMESLTNEEAEVALKFLKTAHTVRQNTAK